MKKIGYIGAALLFPALASAQTVTSVQSLAAFVINLINTVAVPLVFALAFIVFIWGVFLYFIAGASDEEKQGKGKSLMLYGLIGFFVMASVWGLVNILTGTVKLDNNSPRGSELPVAPTTR
ncbi:MAG: seg [Parcubacteria group bacterium]|nr:seg [Parcubacteria group bacterium]